MNRIFYIYPVAAVLACLTLSQTARADFFDDARQTFEGDIPHFFQDDIPCAFGGQPTSGTKPTCNSHNAPVRPPVNQQNYVPPSPPEDFTPPPASYYGAPPNEGYTSTPLPPPPGPAQ